MKKLLNTLYVQSQGSYLRQEGETVVVERERAVVARIPIHTLSGIVCFGNVLDFESLSLTATLTNSFSDSFGTGAFSLAFDWIYDDGKLSAERTCKSFLQVRQWISRVCPGSVLGHAVWNGSREGGASSALAAPAAVQKRGATPPNLSASRSRTVRTNARPSKAGLHGASFAEMAYTPRAWTTTTSPSQRPANSARSCRICGR